MGKHSAWLIATLFVGCVDSSSVQCGFGLCPQGSTCDEAAEVCIPAGCGDGVVSGDEQCDGTVDPTFDCTAFGFYQAEGLKCSSACKLDTSGCAQSCGDHEINGPETCDGIPPVNQTCGDYGFGIGRLACSTECAPGFVQCASIGWRRGRASAPDDLHGMWGTSQTNIYAIGNSGVILHAGVSGVYGAEVSGTTVNLNGIWGAGPNDVFAVGDGGTLLHSDGTTWTTIASGTTANLNAISGHLTISGTTITNVQIWAVGDGGTVVSTAYAPGGSAAWSPETSGVITRLRGVWADGTSSVVAVGDAAALGSGNPTALQRQLTSATWTPVPTQTIQVAANVTPTLMAVWGSGTGFVAVGTPTIATNPPRSVVLEYTVNTAGVFAFTGQSTSSQLLTSVWGTVTPLPSDVTKTRTDIFIGGNGGTMLHFDGVGGPGHFEALHMNTTLGAYGIWGTGPAFVRAAMIGGDIEEYDGTDLSSEVVAPGIKLDAIWHDPVSNIAIAAGASGTVVRHDFTGWGTPTTPNNTLATWTGILGFGSIVFMCGENGNGIIKSIDDGQNWSNNAGSFPGVFWEALWGLSATSVWAVGDGGHVSHYDGTSWSTPIVVPFTPIPALRSVWGSSDADLFAVGSNGFIGHYNGTSWTQLDSTLGSGQAINGVWGSGPSDVFAEIGRAHV